MRIENKLPGIKMNVPLKNYTTFGIGGPARYFFIAKTKFDLIEAIKIAKKFNLPFFILGGGSNLLVSDRGFNGLVIRYGQPLSSWVSKGLEWAVGIPGTLQGAVWGNTGAFGRSMKDVVKEIEVFDTKTGKIKIFKNEDCQFSYRNSIFKEKKNLIILSVKIKSKKSNLQKIKQYLKYRKETQPLEFPSAGSIFKNPDKFSAAELIEKCGLKGKRIGGVQISKKHANFIVNLGNGRARDVIKLINLAKKSVKKKFGITLEEEIVILDK
ncbi:MAG: UDP-N-acetylmuramate dehydrogenase [Patescibacteria group bacterium]|nr:UDP-N-acetylmuramate dehydrogenase [Patescibacteria group bacterium]